MPREITVGIDYEVQEAWTKGKVNPSHTASNKINHKDGVLYYYRTIVAVMYRGDGVRNKATGAIVTDVRAGGGWGRQEENHGESARYELERMEIPFATVSGLYGTDVARIQNEETREGWIRGKAQRELQDARERYAGGLGIKLAIPWCVKHKEVVQAIDRANDLLCLIGYERIPRPPELRVHEEVDRERTEVNKVNWLVRETSGQIGSGDGGERGWRRDKYGRRRYVNPYSQSYGPRDSVRRSVGFKWTEYDLQYPDRCRNATRGEKGWVEWLRDESRTLRKSSAKSN